MRFKGEVNHEREDQTVDQGLPALNPDICPAGSRIRVIYSIQLSVLITANNEMRETS